jgi:hypothetical protein
MKKYLIGLMSIVTVMQSCQKERAENPSTEMPGTQSSFQQRNLEISKRERGTALIFLFIIPMAGPRFHSISLRRIMQQQKEQSPGKGAY